MSIKNTISSTEFFSSLSEDNINILTSISTLNSYSKNYILNYEKKESNQMLFLINGLAKAYKIDKYENEIFLYYVYKNSLLSEISSTKDEYLYSFSNMEVMEESQILSINYKKFREEFLNKNLLYREFTNEILKRSLQFQSLINREFVFDSVAKVAMMISSDLDMFNKLKRNEISLILHIQPATLSRVLNRLKRNQILDIIQGRVTILDHTALDAIHKE